MSLFELQLLERTRLEGKTGILDVEQSNMDTIGYDRAYSRLAHFTQWSYSSYEVWDTDWRIIVTTYSIVQRPVGKGCPEALKSSWGH